MCASRKISVVGLGYVGLPVAVAFGRLGRVVGFDQDLSRIAELRAGHDRTGEVSDADLGAADIQFTVDPTDLAAADFHIVAVPTPVDETKQPDLTALRSASRTVGGILKHGDIVVYESTVYPGVTEEECVPMLEQVSRLVAGQDFTVGYSPERINPGDSFHRFETIAKVVSGQDAATLEVVAAVYGSVVQAGVHRAASIKVAEAAKVIENTQRDINIALMNELAVIFGRLGIDTADVLAAAGTKWNFLPFSPGLVGGHCIGVDPYYLTYQAERFGYHPQVILAGRRINDGMGAYVAQETAKRLMCKYLGRRPRVAVLGLTFKEDVCDVRNSRSIDIVRELETFGIEVLVHDPLANPGTVTREFGLHLFDFGLVSDVDAVVLAVPHRPYLAGGWGLIRSLLREGKGLVMDVKARLDRSALPAGIELWRL
jgi:UDP-N-acetyl-D-galactosamine dehydrogenase